MPSDGFDSGSGTERESGLGDALSGLVKMNDLAYEAEEEYTLTSQVRMREFPFLNATVTPSSTAFVDLSVGSDLINGRKSWLQFNISFTGTDAGTDARFPPAAGATQLFRQILIQARSGTEISRHLAKNFQARHEMSVSKPIGSSLMFGATLGANGAAYAVGAATTEYTICIPLADLHSFFDTKSLIPTNVMGLIRLELSTVANADGIITTANHAITWQLSKLAVWCQTHTLSDAGQKAMAFIAADRGLNFYFTDVVVTSQPVNNTNAFSMTNTQARSRCVGAWLHIANTAFAATITADTTATVPILEATQIFWGLGSLYWPIRPVSGLSNLFHHFLVHENAYVCGMHERVPEISFSGDVPWNTTYNFQSVSLERSEILEANGSAIGASRPLTLQVTGATAIASILAYMFVKHHKLLTIASDGNMVISE